MIMSLPLMPKATAVWLIENTTLTFEQVAKFCGMHTLEIKGIADEEVAIGIAGVNPITHEQITREELKRCEDNPDATIQLSEQAKNHIKVNDKKRKTSNYTPIAKRQDKPDAVSWFLRNYPNVIDQHIIKLIGTTKNTINSVRGRTHWNMTNIKPRDPVLLGLCSQTDLEKVIEKARVLSEGQQESRE
jgi:uncharacterized protein